MCTLPVVILLLSNHVNGYYIVALTLGGIDNIYPGLPDPIDFGETLFNDLVSNSSHHIIRRECSACSIHQDVYYKRLTLTSSFNYHANMFNWVNTDNNIGIDFNLYSTLNDAMNDANAWTFCNYNDPDVGAFRDCGPTAETTSQWVSAPGGDFERARVGKFSIYIEPPTCLTSPNIKSFNVASLSNWTQIAINETIVNDTTFTVVDDPNCFNRNPCIKISGIDPFTSANVIYIEQIFNTARLSYISMYIEAFSFSMDNNQESGFVETVCNNDIPQRTTFNHKKTKWYFGCYTVNTTTCNNIMTIRIGGYLSGQDDCIYITQMQYKFTKTPTTSPTELPTNNPTVIPTVNPTINPTTQPTFLPTFYPSNNPTIIPTIIPTIYPTNNPITGTPTTVPTNIPTNSPSAAPTVSPTRTDEGDVNDDIFTTFYNKETGSSKETQGVSSESFFMVGMNMLFILVIIIGVLLCVCCLLWIYFLRKRKKISQQTNSVLELEVYSGTDGNDTTNIQSTITPMAETDVYSDNTAMQMWLNTIGMMEYYDLFIQHGVGDKMDALSTLTDEELQRIGINKLAHRKKILLQIENNKNITSQMDEYNMNSTNTALITDIGYEQQVSNNNDNDNDMYQNIHTKHNEYETPSVDTQGQYDTKQMNKNNMDVLNEEYDEQDNEDDDEMYQQSNNVTQR